MNNDNVLGDSIGFVKYIQHMGSDKMIVNAARASFGAENDQPFNERDAKLIKYLILHDHGSVLEHCYVTFSVKCPIFIARQWMRHRMASYNEISARYTEVKDEFYLPETWRKQHDKSKQCSTDETIAIMKRSHNVGEWKDTEYHIENLCRNQTDDTIKIYHDMLNVGVAREQARGILPQCAYTQFYFTANLRSLFNFLKLRDDSHAQWEIQQYAKSLRHILNILYPETMKIFNKIKYTITYEENE